MLSRVAESLYWIGRYLERAENVNRLLLVTTEVAVEIEGLDDSLAQTQWDELLTAVGSSPDPDLHFSPESGLALPYVHWLLLDDDNPVSVRKRWAWPAKMHVALARPSPAKSFSTSTKATANSTD